jgi:hypothetical protein
MEQDPTHKSVLNMLFMLIEYAHRLDKSRDVMSLSFLKKDLQKFCEKYQE